MKQSFIEKLFIALICFLLFSCNSDNRDNNINNAQSLLDSLHEAKHLDSMYEDRMKEAYLSDTLLLSEAPIQIVSAKVEYGGAVKLKYKNVSEKTISAIKFLWYGVDAFYDPVDLGHPVPGAGGGYADKILKAGSSDEGYWGSENDRLKSIIKAWPTEVAFSDGTKWKIK